MVRRFATRQVETWNSILSIDTAAELVCTHVRYNSVNSVTGTWLTQGGFKGQVPAHLWGEMTQWIMTGRSCVCTGFISVILLWHIDCDYKVLFYVSCLFLSCYLTFQWETSDLICYPLDSLSSISTNKINWVCHKEDPPLRRLCFVFSYRTKQWRLYVPQATEAWRVRTAASTSSLTLYMLDDQSCYRPVMWRLNSSWTKCHTSVPLFHLIIYTDVDLVLLRPLITETSYMKMSLCSFFSLSLCLTRWRQDNCLCVCSTV